jgi:hypothetical protein
MSAQIPNIESWLNGPRNYAEGLELFRKYSNNEVLKKALSFGENSWSKSKLATELHALISVPELPIITKKAELSTPVQVNRAPEQGIAGQARNDARPQNCSDLNSVIADLEKKWRKLYAEGSALNLEKFREDVPQNERMEAAFRIQEIDEECKDIWTKLDHYKAHGFLPEVAMKAPKVNVDDRAEMIKRRNTLRTYLTRYKNNPAKLQTFTNELEEIERRLGNA